MSELKPVVNRSISPMDQVRGDLNKMSDQFKMALPPNVTPERFIRVTLTALQNNQDLLGCERQTLFSAAMRCAQDGLLPDGKEAAFVKYGMRVQYLPMIGGILKKIRNSGELSDINAQVVYKNDEFDYWTDENGEHLKYRQMLDGDRGGPRATFAIARTKDKAVYIEVMGEDQMNAVRNMSRAKDSGPWNGPFADEMRRKTAIRRLSKRLPMSTDVEELIRRDDEMYDLKESNGTKGKAEELSEKIRLSMLSSSEPMGVDLPVEEKKVE